MKQIYRCLIKTLSPIHIGCDEVYEPMGFVVDENKNEISVFDPITFISSLDGNDKRRFSEICSKGTIESILEIYKFLRGRATGGKKVQLCSGFVIHYNKTLSMPMKDKKKIQKELNRFSISRTSFLSADGRPFIPGSSVKGSLRTAYLNHLARSNRIPTPKSEHASTDLEKKLMHYSDISNDPFRMVKVSDFMPVGGIQTKINYAVNIKKGSNRATKGPPQILEIIMPSNVFLGTIVVEKPLSKRIIKNPVKLEELLQSSRLFYSKEYKREHGELKDNGVSSPDTLFNKGSVPMRLGRHSGAEAVTVEDHRSIKIMGGRGIQPSFKDHATTMWLAANEPRPQNNNNLQPFGWAELCEITPADEDEFKKNESEWLTHLQLSFQENRNISMEDGPHKNVYSVPEINEVPDSTQEPIIWEKAIINYAKNTGEIAALFENKKAFSKELSFVPELVLLRLKKGKFVEADVKVELIGGKNYKLLEILQ